MFDQLIDATHRIGIGDYSRSSSFSWGCRIVYQLYRVGRLIGNEIPDSGGLAMSFAVAVCRSRQSRCSKKRQCWRFSSSWDRN